MNTTVIGGGSVGLAFASLLSRVEPVLLLVRRQEQVELIDSEGVLVEGPESSELFRPSVTKDVGELADSDVILVLTKAYDTEVVAKTIAEHAKPDAVVLSLQNGLGSIETLNECCGSTRVLCGMTLIASTRIDDRHVRYTGRLDRVPIGEQNGPPTDRCREIAERLTAAGFEGAAPDNIWSEIWTKLALSVGQNAMSALTNASFGDLRSSDDALDLVRSLLDEFQLLAREAGISLLVDPYSQLMTNWASVPNHHSSMWQDLKAGRLTEIEAINGAVVARAAAHGIAMPANQTITQLMRVRQAVSTPASGTRRESGADQ